MIKNTIKICLVMTILAGLTACETTSKSSIKSIGSSGSPSTKSEFDRQKAAQIRLSAGLQYLNKGSYQNAKRHLDKALALGANSANVHFGIAFYYEKVKEFDKAKKSYKKALKMEPKNPDFLNGYGSYLCGIGKFKEANKYFDKAIDSPIYPDVSSALLNAGVCNKRGGNKNQAAVYFRKALNRNNKLPVALIEMAEFEFDKERYQRSYSYIKRYETVSAPSSQSLWLALRVAHFRKNKDDLASYAIKLERLFPDSEETATFLDNKKKWM